MQRFENYTLHLTAQQYADLAEKDPACTYIVDGVVVLSPASLAAVRGAFLYSPPSVNSRDGMGRVTSLTMDAVTYTITYGAYGPATLSGGGKTVTYNYSATGLYTGATVA